MDVKYAKWFDYKVHKKHKIWDMLTKIGDEVVVVYGSGKNVAKSGLSKSLTDYGAREGKVMRIVYRSAHLVKVRFEGCV